MASPAKRQSTVGVGGKIDIHESAGGGRLADVKAYLKAGGLIDKRDADRWTPLMMAVREGHLEVAKVLLRSGATLEARDSDKWTAMHVAAANGHPQCCQLLLDRGANPRAVDENKRTPLHWATRYGYAAVAELLLRRGADANFKDVDGKTPGDVVGADLAEDSREIIHALLREHAERLKSSKQRRGSCPAIPRAALISAVDASISTKATAGTPTSTRTPDENQPLIPLPSVLVRKGVVEHEGAGDTSTSRGGNEEIRASSVATAQRNSRRSFSAAAHIRDHPLKNETLPDASSSAMVAAAAAAAAAAATTSTTPAPLLTSAGILELPAPTDSNSVVAVPASITRESDPHNSCTGVISERTNADVHNAACRNSLSSTGMQPAPGVGEGEPGAPPDAGEEHGIDNNNNINDGGVNSTGGRDPGVVVALKLALRSAEERAQEAERARSREREERLREEERARALEERVAELERILSARV